MQQECTTSNGCVLFGGLNASRFMMLFPAELESLLAIYDFSNDPDNVYYYVNTLKGVQSTSFNSITKRQNNNIIMHDVPQSYVSKSIYYYACK